MSRMGNHDTYESEDEVVTPSVTERRTIDINITSINGYLTCTLCNGYFKEAATIAECLHTFCKSCLYLHLVNTPSTKCPTCAVELAPHPLDHIRSDSMMQHLVDTIFPHLVIQDQEKERQFYALYQIPLKSSMIVARNNQTSSSSTMTMSSSKRKQEKQPTLSFQLEPDVTIDDTLRLKALHRRYIRTSGSTRVGQIVKYVTKKFKKEYEVDICCDGRVLNPRHTLHFIQRTVWVDQTHLMTLHYRKKPSV